MMARNDIDVSLVIRAKDDAAKAIGSVNQALKELKDLGGTVASSVTAVGNATDTLGRQMRQTAIQIQGLTALDKVVTSLNNAAQNVANIESKLQSSRGTFDSLASELTKAKVATDQLQASSVTLAKNLQAEQSAFQVSQRAANSSAREMERASNAIARYQASIQAGDKSTRTLNALTAAQTRLADATQRNTDAQARASQGSAQTGAARNLYEQNAQSLAVATQQSSALEKEMQRVSRQVETYAQGLAKATTAQGEIAKGASELASTLGLVDHSTQTVTSALGRMRQQEASLLEIQNRFAASAKGVSVVNPNASTYQSYLAQSRALRETAAAYQVARAAATDLGRQLAQTDSPTRELTSDFEIARLNAKSLEQQMQALARGLNQVRNSSRDVTGIQAVFPSMPAVSTGTPARQASAAGQTGFNTSATVAGLREMSSETQKSIAYFRDLREQILTLATAFIGLNTAINETGKVIDVIRSVDTARSTLATVENGNMQAVAADLQFLSSESTRLGLRFGQLSGDFGKLSIAAKSAGISADTTRKVFTAVAEAGRVAHLSADDVTGSFIALTQMMSKGTVQSEELRGQLGDRLPGAFNLMAQALGVSTAKLNDMLKAGQVLANDDTFTKFADALTKAYGSELSTALQSTIFEVDSFLANLDKARLVVAEGGFAEGLKTALKELNSYFESKDGVEFFAQIGAAAGNLAQILVVLAKNMDLVEDAIALTVIAKIAPAFSAAGTAAVQFGKDAVASLRSVGSETTASNLLKTLANQWSFLLGKTKEAQIATNAAAQVAASASVGLTGVVTGMTQAGVAIEATSRKMVFANASAKVLAVGFGLVSTAVKGLWAALGGLPGLILTGITFAISKWLTSVNDTDSALIEHKRLMDQIVIAWKDAKGNVDKYRESVKTSQLIPLDQQESNFRQLQSVDTSARGALTTNARSSLFNASGNNADDVKAYKDLLVTFTRGQITLDDFTKSLNALNASTDDDNLKEYIAKTLDLSRAAQSSRKDLEDSAIAVTTAGSKMKAANDIAGGLKRGMDDLTKATDALNNSFDNNKALDAYNEGLDELKAKIPELSKSLKELKADAEIDTSYNKAVEGLQSSLANGGIDDRQASVMQRRLDDTRQQAIVGQRVATATADPKAFLRPYAASGVDLDNISEEVLKRLAEAAARLSPDQLKGFTLTSGYRSIADQQRLYDNRANNPNPVARPGYSSHNIGTAVDISGVSPALRESLQQSGFGQPVKNDPVHYELVADTQKRQYQEAEKAAEEAAREQERQTKAAQAFHDTLGATIESQKAQLEGAKESTREATIQKTLQDTLNQAKKAGTSLTQDEQDTLVKNVGALWDMKHAQDAYNAARKDATAASTHVNDLFSQRDELAKQVEVATGQGNTDQADALRKRIDEINSELQKAVDTAVNLWKTVQGTATDTANKQNAAGYTDAAATSFGAATDASDEAKKLEALKANILEIPPAIYSAKQANEDFANGMGQAFQTSLQAVGNLVVGIGSVGDAFKTAGEAFASFAANFLAQIAQMILQAEVLRLITGSDNPSAAGQSSGGIGGFISGLVGSIFGSSSTAAAASSSGVPFASAISAYAHTGGIVGALTMHAPVSPGVFFNAPRFHEGGLPGLGNDEVATILKKREEVLAEDDPRNVLNGGAASSKSNATGSNVNIRSVVVLDPSHVSDAMNNSSGERVVMAHVAKNKDTLKQLMGIK